MVLFQTNYVNTLLNGLDPFYQKSLTLRPGQFINGEIVKIYPGQLASIRLRGVTLTAKLEASLIAGSRYWFQVQPKEGLPVLKVFDDVVGDVKLPKQLGLNSKLTDLVVKSFVQEDLPFTREQVVRGAEVLQSVSMADEQGLSILRLLVKKNLPITHATFKAMHSMSSGQGFATHFDELLFLLQSEKIKEPVLFQVQQVLETIMTKANFKVDQHIILDLLKLYIKDESKTVQSQEAQLLLQKLGIIEHQSSKEIVAQFKETLTKADEAHLKQIWPTLVREQILLLLTNGKIDDLLAKVVLEKNEDGERTLQQLLSMFSAKGEKSMVRSVYQQEETIGKQLASIIHQIGYQHERNTFLLTDQNSEAFLTQLKGLLIKSQQIQLPSSIESKIEAILNRITGQQLLAVNQEGPMAHQSVMIPLKLFGEITDLTIQWEGKKEQDGKFNPDHCRILFYLHLGKIKDTVIDVQIQKRIVSLQIYNEFDKPEALIGVFLPYLKKSLTELNYQLSSLKWTQPKKSPKHNNKSNQISPINSYYQPNRQYQGVDIRI